jgi:hypothetical protein
MRKTINELYVPYSTRHGHQPLDHAKLLLRSKGRIMHVKDVEGVLAHVCFQLRRRPVYQTRKIEAGIVHPTTSGLELKGCEKQSLIGERMTSDASSSLSLFIVPARDERSYMRETTRMGQ